MAKCTCAISGLRFNTNYLDGLVLPANEGFPHPIFAAPKKYLERLYTAHCRGKLGSTESYLLFMALLHSSDAITWQHPATLKPMDSGTKALIENNLKQLVEVLEKTEGILHPSFEQPRFIVSYDNANLKQIPNWIKAWDENIKSFYAGTGKNADDLDRLHNAEAKLSKLILDPMAKEENYTAEIAEWADRAAEFPSDKRKLWKDVIKSCFDINAMFNTPLATIKEVKEYCESNIEVGSIHFHTLHKVLVEGINRHVDYLGGSSLALGYELLPPSSDKRPQLLALDTVTTHSQEAKANHAKATTAMIANAPKTAPVRTDYATAVDFLRARLAYRVADSSAKQVAERERAESVKALIQTTKEGL